MVGEKIGTKVGDGDWSKLEGPGEPSRTKLKRDGTSSKARERCTTSSEKVGRRSWS